MTWLLGIAKNVLGGLWGYVATGGAVLIAVLAIFKSGKSSGQSEVIVESAKKGIENAQKANEADRQVAATKSTDKRKRLHDAWSRD